MKKLVLLVSIFAFLGLFQSVSAQETTCISLELDGSLTLRVWGTGRNRADAREQAKKNAVYEVLFNGITKTTGDNASYDVRPLIPEVNARERYRDYFDIFFKDGGEYRHYVSLADRRWFSTKRVKIRNQVKYCMTIRVLVPELRQRMIQDGILKN